MNIKQWANNRMEEMIQEIKGYIDDGWNKQKALETVLNESTIGSVIKGQIRYEIKCYNA